MAFRYHLYINVTDQRLSATATTGSGGVLPPLVAGDTVPLSLVFVERTQDGALARFSAVPVAGFSAEVGVGVEGSTPVAQSSSWTVDPANSNTLIGSLALTSAAAITAANNGTDLVFEIRLSVDGTTYQTVFKQATRIKKSVNATPIAAVIPAENAITENKANSRFAKLQGLPGETQAYTSPSGTYRRYVGVDDTGAPVDYIAPI